MCHMINKGVIVTKMIFRCSGNNERDSNRFQLEILSFLGGRAFLICHENFVPHPSGNRVERYYFTGNYSLDFLLTILTISDIDVRVAVTFFATKS